MLILSCCNAFVVAPVPPRPAAKPQKPPSSSEYDEDDEDDGDPYDEVADLPVTGSGRPVPDIPVARPKMQAGAVALPGNWMACLKSDCQ